MLLGTPSLSSAEEQEIKNTIRSQAKYAEHREAFEEIDQLLLTDKREGLIKDVTVLSLYNRCNQDIDAAKKAALKAKQSDSSDRQDTPAPTLHFAYSSAPKPISPQSGPLESSQAREFAIRPIGSDVVQKEKKKGCCNLL
jgi:hypothetical protein